MNVHKNAPLTPKGREAMVRSVVEGGLTQAAAAATPSSTAAAPTTSGILGTLLASPTLRVAPILRGPFAAKASA
ncbi:hypothetical protein ACVWW4_002667 [Bradyrhizobium sp. LB7.1]